MQQKSRGAKGSHRISKYFASEKLVQLIADEDQYVNYDAKLSPQTKLRFDLQG